MQNKPINQNEWQPLPAAEAQQIAGGAKNFPGFPPGVIPPFRPIFPIRGPLPIFDPELGITIC